MAKELKKEIGKRRDRDSRNFSSGFILTGF
jgi:hypothetical protein